MFLERLKQEYVELKEKTNKLSSFIVSENFNKIESDQRELLDKQVVIMKEYLECLKKRLTLLKVDIDTL